METTLPSAFELLPTIRQAWEEAGKIGVLLDFDGTLAGIVEHPDDAGISEELRSTLERVAESVDGLVAIISGRGLEDVRERVRIDGIAYAGNHGMEIEGAEVSRTHPSAVAARPRLEKVIRTLTPTVDSVPGAILEDKGLTLTLHYRKVARDFLPLLRGAVHDAVRGEDDLRVTEGKEILEIRPNVEWDKGRAAEFLLEWAGIPADAPVIYIGDDLTDEDAFAVVGTRRNGFGVLVGDAQVGRTAARAGLETTEEVGQLLDLLVS